MLTLRVPAALGQRLAYEARRRHVSRSVVARHALEQGLAQDGALDLAREARRQSLRARRGHSNDGYWLAVADAEGWK